MFQSDLVSNEITSPRENSMMSSSQNYDQFEKDTLGTLKPFAFNIEELEVVPESSGEDAI